MAYKVIILYQLYMPSYFLGTFTEYPYLHYFLMRTLAHFLQSSTKLSILSEKSILFLNKYFNKVFRVIHLSIMHDKKIS